jgi:hypothetical protein
MTTLLTPDVRVRVRLRTAEEGGRQKGEIPPVQFRCPFVFEGEMFDCRLLLDQVGTTLQPGASYEKIPVKFLFPDLIKPRLRPGVSFKLWDGRDIADGEVTDVVADS